MLMTGFCIGLIIMFFWTPYLLSKGIYEMSEGKLTGTQKVSCFIPLFNIVRAEKMYFGKIFLVFYSVIAIVLFTAFRFFTLFFMRENITICMVSVWLFIISLGFAYFANVHFVYTVLIDSGTKRTIEAIIFSIIYPFGQFYIGNYIVTVIKNTQQKMEIFKE